MKSVFKGKMAIKIKLKIGIILSEFWFKFSERLATLVIPGKRRGKEKGERILRVNTKK